MRIAITSDIHFFPQWGANIKRLAEILQSHRPDVMILAGDIGEPLDMFVHGLEAFEPVCQLRAAVAGNHDVWHRTFPYTSEKLWRSLLQEAAHGYGYAWLDRENMTVGDLGICGTVGWYDYGGRHPRLKFGDEFYEQIKEKLSNDANYIDWPWNDREFAQQVAAEFQERLDALENEPEVRDTLVVTHVPLFRECLKPYFTPEQGIVNAYYANIGLGEQVLLRRKVRTVVSGHVHVERQILKTRYESVIPTGDPPLYVYTVPSDYGKPAALLLDTDTWEAEVIRLSKPQQRE